MPQTLPLPEIIRGTFLYALFLKNQPYKLQSSLKDSMLLSALCCQILRFILYCLGILLNVSRILRSWAIYTLVLVAWLGIVPVTACRIYRIVFSASLSNMLSLPFQLFSLDNLLIDCFKVSCIQLPNYC